MNPYLPAASVGDSDYYFEFSICEYDEVPIVFVATDDRKELYLCECTDMRFGEQNWTIATTTEDTIRDLIDQRITLYEALERGTRIVLVKCDLRTKKFSHKATGFNRLTPEEMPEVDSYVWVTNDAVEECFRELLLDNPNTSLKMNYVCDAVSQTYVQTRIAETANRRIYGRSQPRPSTATITIDNSPSYYGNSKKNAFGDEAA